MVECLVLTGHCPEGNVVFCALVGGMHEQFVDPPRKNFGICLIAVVFLMQFPAAVLRVCADHR